MKPHLLKAERERRGWTLVKLAEELGTTTRTVSRWEQGLVVPYPYYREQLCMLYEKTAEELGLLPDDHYIVGAHDGRDKNAFGSPSLKVVWEPNAFQGPDITDNRVPSGSNCQTIYRQLVGAQFIKIHPLSLSCLVRVQPAQDLMHPVPIQHLMMGERMHLRMHYRTK